MDNGAGDFAAIYKPPAKNELCDGEWHSITGTYYDLVCQIQ